MGQEKRMRINQHWYAVCKWNDLSPLDYATHEHSNWALLLGNLDGGDLPSLQRRSPSVSLSWWPSHCAKSTGSCA